jgi:hypothetical protein
MNEPVRIEWQTVPFHQQCAGVLFHSLPSAHRQQLPPREQLHHLAAVPRAAAHIVNRLGFRVRPPKPGGNY